MVARLPSDLLFFAADPDAVAVALPRFSFLPIGTVARYTAVSLATTAAGYGRNDGDQISIAKIL